MQEPAAMKQGDSGANTRFSDIVIDDTKLSLAAKGVFVTIGLLGSGCQISTLERRCTDTSETVMSAVQELVEGGYVSIDQGAVLVHSRTSFGITS
jgi:hypothetical protein